MQDVRHERTFFVIAISLVARKCLAWNHRAEFTPYYMFGRLTAFSASFTRRRHTCNLIRGHTQLRCHWQMSESTQQPWGSRSGLGNAKDHIIGNLVAKTRQPMACATSYIRF